MKILFIIELLLISFSGYCQSLREVLLKNDTTIEDVKIIKCKTSPDLFIAISITHPDFWEAIDVIKFRDKKIIWKAKFDSLPGAAGNYSARQIALKGIPNPVFEIFYETLHGLGDYYLFELVGTDCHLIANTSAIDGNVSEDIEIGKLSYDQEFDLKPVYTDLNNDGIEDVLLEGKMTMTSFYDNKLYKKTKAQKALIYNKDLKKFLEEPSYRKGFLKTQQSNSFYIF